MAEIEAFWQWLLGIVVKFNIVVKLKLTLSCSVAVPTLA